MSSLISLYLTDYNDCNLPVTPDDRDMAIAEERLKKFDQDPDPRVGDFVITPEGKLQRIAYCWPDQLQTCDGGSFFLGNGYADMSGGLDPGFKKEAFKITEEKKPGRFWFFHHDYRMAHNGIGVLALCRVYKVIV